MIDGRLLSLLQQIHAIASEGLKYCKEPYDIARYEKLLEMAVEGYAPILNIDPDILLKQFRADYGVITPRVGTDAAILNTRGELLLLKRADEQTWCMPCGWVDVGETPAQAAVREAFEEAQVHVTPIGYLRLGHKGPHVASHLYHQINLLTLMETVPDDTQVTLSHEHMDYRWITSPDEIDRWHFCHDIQVKTVFDFMASDRTAVLPIL